MFFTAFLYPVYSTILNLKCILLAFAVVHVLWLMEVLGGEEIVKQKNSYLMRNGSLRSNYLLTSVHNASQGICCG